jgi:hypothetical protein
MALCGVTIDNGLMLRISESTIDNGLMLCTMGLQWVYNGTRMGLEWVYNGSRMGLEWV